MLQRQCREAESSAVRAASTSVIIPDDETDGTVHGLFAFLAAFGI